MSNIDHNKFAENFDKIFRSKPMDDSIRELDLELGNARVLLGMYEELRTKTKELCGYVEKGMQGDATRTTPAIWAIIEEIRRFEANA
jgi:hypothetical protein